MLHKTDLIEWVRRQPRWRWLAGVVAVVGVTGYLGFRPGAADQNGTTFAARRGPMDIAILEGGSIEALESQEIRSEIKGFQGSKILNIVDEGYLVTEEDVKNGKVLVELDSSDIRQRTITEEIQFQSTLAGLTEAQQSFDIQLNQNITDVKAAEQKAKFARMDFEKYMGERAGQEILAQLGLQDEPWTNAAAASASVESVPLPAGYDNGKLYSLTNMQSLDQMLSGTASFFGASNGPALSLASNAPARPASAGPSYAAGSLSNAIAQIDFSKYADTNVLGDGAANQQLRKLEDDKLMSVTELKQAQTKLEGTERLHKKGFVTKTELENDQISVEKAALKLKTADTSLNLFIKYEFPKSAEEFLSKYDEALRGLERTRKEAVSKLAQAQAKLKSSIGRFQIEVAQRNELYDQLAKCVLKAQKPGLVVYATPGDHWGGMEAIREGATVRERQRIITIPDMTQMSVRIKIHESHIKKVAKGLKAKVTIDAFPDEKLTGEVCRVSVLPDSQNRWMNPDLKVYITYISIQGVYEWVKPGMSAKVEIMVNRLPDVIYIPLQAVTYNQGKQVCYVVHGGQADERVVEVGEYNDDFIEIKKGLKEGELVLLRAPEGTEPEAQETAPAEEIPGEPKAKPEPAPTPGPAPAARPGPAITSGPEGNRGAEGPPRERRSGPSERRQRPPA